MSQRRTGTRCGLSYRRGRRRLGFEADILGSVSSEDAPASDTTLLDADEQAWLVDRLAEYRELLAYLREH